MCACDVNKTMQISPTYQRYETEHIQKVKNNKNNNRNVRR